MLVMRHFGNRCWGKKNTMLKAITVNSCATSEAPRFPFVVDVINGQMHAISTQKRHAKCSGEGDAAHLPLLIFDFLPWEHSRYKRFSFYTDCCLESSMMNSSKYPQSHNCLLGFCCCCCWLCYLSAYYRGILFCVFKVRSKWNENVSLGECVLQG